MWLDHMKLFWEFNPEIEFYKVDKVVIHYLKPITIFNKIYNFLVIEK